VGTSHLVSEPLQVKYIVYGTIFENRGEDMLQCPYKDYTSFNRWQANRDLLSAIYFFVTMHLHQGKKVSILSLGDANLGPVPTRRGCLRIVPIVR
jgi:hypothetical protein